MTLTLKTEPLCVYCFIIHVTRVMMDDVYFSRPKFRSKHRRCLKELHRVDGSFLSMFRIKPRALHTQDECSTTEFTPALGVTFFKDGH